MLVGLGSYTFFYAEGVSYFSENPKVCTHCHIMKQQFQAWTSSGHHHVATCNDCHLPHQGFQKYLAKARNGWNHSVAFTLENFPEPIQITPRSRQILEKNCVRCHGGLVHESIQIPSQRFREAVSCTRCHRNVGHMPVY